jgi:long-subunit acyl-CoA synthetase (AMP-forming)
VKESATGVPRVWVSISSEKMSQVASIWVNIKFLSLFYVSIC